jgi:chromosome partitioning protein
MSTRIIALTNQKGGCGKTTTAVNLSAALASMGQRVLLLDMDPQGNASIHLGIGIYELSVSMYDVLVDQDKMVRDVIHKTAVENLDIVPSNIELSGAELELVNVIGRESALKDSMDDIENKYDFVFIDCPPSLGLLTLNALTTSTEVMVPVQTEYFALEGMKKLLKSVEVVKRRLNHNLEVTGIIPTMYDIRTNLSDAIIKKMIEHFGDKVFKTRIRKNIRLAEAPSFGIPIEVYSPNSHGAHDYYHLAKEVLNHG